MDDHQDRRIIFADELYDAHKNDCFVVRGPDGMRYFPPFPKCSIKFQEETVNICMYDKQALPWFHQYLRNESRRNIALVNARLGTRYSSFLEIPPFFSVPPDLKELIHAGRQKDGYLQLGESSLHKYQKLEVFHKKKKLSELFQPLDQNGNIIPGAFIQSFDKSLIPTVSKNGTPPDKMKILHKVDQSITFSLFALSVMNCRDIGVDEVPAKERIHHRGCRTGDRQYVLTVHPMAKQKRHAHANRPSQDKASEMALHVRRGHFGDYTKGRGLFGRINGVFWFSDTTIGNQKNGIIKKDYKLPDAPTR